MTPSIPLIKPSTAILDALLFVRAALNVETSNIFVAGGCLRDHIIGRRDSKDIDIFVVNLHDEAQRFVELFSFDVIEVTRDEPISPNGNVDDKGSKVISSTRVYIKESNIDVIFLNDSRYTDIYSVLTSFDIGLCKVAHTGSCWILHEEFVKDLNEECIRVSARGAYGLDSVRNRLKKLKEYYPDFVVDDSYLLTLERESIQGSATFEDF